MSGEGGSRTPPPIPTEKDKFARLVASQSKKTTNEASPNFVKRIKDVPVVALPSEDTIWVALSLADRALIGQFIGLWPSPKTTES